jgi:outer membrane biosynthesis protein TonB
MPAQFALTLPQALRKAAGPAALLLLALVGWWLMGIDKVENRVRDEEVEMFDLSVPPPPPPPPPEPVEQPVVTPEKVAAEAQAIQPDPLSPPQPASTNPPAGDLSSLMQDPTSDSGAFAGGARGQGGTGKGPVIGGIGKGSANGASRAYAELVQRALMRHLRKRANLAAAQFDFRVSVHVSASGQLEVLGLSNVRPPSLESELLQTLRSLSRVDTPPPAGVPNQITLQLNQV